MSIPYYEFVELNCVDLARIHVIFHTFAVAGLALLIVIVSNDYFKTIIIPRFMCYKENTSKCKSFIL